MTFAAACSQERSEQWTDVWPAMKHTMWHGDNVLIHCIKGRHRGAFLAVLCRALLAGESIEAANRHIEARRETELHKMIKDQGMKKWPHKAFQDTAVGAQHPVPQGYAATEKSSTHVLVESGTTLCQHKQADRKAKPLVNPSTTTDVFEALAWERPWCDQCLPPASWWPRPDPAEFLAFARLAAWPVPAKESRIQPLGAWIRAFNLACVTPRAVTSCTMKTELTLLTPFA